MLRLCDRKNEDNYPNSTLLVGLTLVNFYLEVYSDILCKTQSERDFELYEQEIAIMENVDQMLAESRIRDTLIIYILKKVKLGLNLSTS